MKSNRLRIPLILLALSIPLVMVSQPGEEDADALLENYLETGSKEYMEKINASFPGSPYSLFCEAYEYLDVNNEKARELAESLTLDHPDFAPGFFAMGTVLVNGYKAYDKAIEQFNIAEDLDPQCPRVYQNRGIAYIGKKDFNKALADFNILISGKRGYAPGYILRGVTNHVLGMQEEFLADFEIGLQIDFKALAPIFSSLVSEAIDNAIESAPENIIYIYARGYANFASGHYRLASADFIKAIEMVPGSSDFYKYSGACELFLDNGEGAQTNLNIALGSNPDDPEIYYYLGVLMNDIRDQPSTAYEYMSNAIELDAQNADYYYERAKASYNMLNYLAAKDDINIALLKDHREGNFYALRGQIKMKLEDSADDFCQDFRQALEWGTSYNLARIMKKSCR